jgi:hypothetical protein
MTTKQIKSEIQKLSDSVPENVLQDFFDLLKQAQKQTSDQLELSKYLKKILTEDKQLLEKLAEG